MCDFDDIKDDMTIKDYVIKYKKIVIIACISILLLITIIVLLNKDEKTKINNEKLLTEANLEKEKKKEEKNGIKKVKVDIKGKVLNPSVYELDNNSRVIDVINKAGGLKEDADTSYINLSKKIKDEMVIIIYSKAEIEKYKKDHEKANYEEIKIPSECPDEMNDACIIERQSESSNKGDSKNTNKNSKSTSTSNNTNKNNNPNNNDEEDIIVSINKASLAELQKLPGIGEAKAQKIIDYRKENGDFETIEDIKNVSGIGDSMFEKIKDKITI